MGKQNQELSGWPLSRLERTQIHYSNVKESIKYSLKSFSIGSVLKNNKKLHNLYHNERCFIMGNGPSLKTMNLDMLKNEFTFGVNEFLINNTVHNINPSFFCLMDPVYYKEEKHIETLVKTLEGGEDITFFLPIEARKVAEPFEGKNKIHYVYSHLFLTDNYDKEIDLAENMPAAWNVVIYCIMIATYLGFKEIYLLGCDFNSFASLKPSHFYEADEKSREISMEFELRAYSNVCREHRIIKKYCEKRNISIYNITPGSLLDVYKRKNYEDVIGFKKPSIDI